MSLLVTDVPISEQPDRRLAEGMKVEVRAGFDGTWNAGFVVEAVTETGYRLRRSTDSQVLPGEFSASNVRRERKSMWWV